MSLDAAAATVKDSLVPFPTVIAIDGPVASGKTAVGRQLARRLKYRFIDTGMMYRACALFAIRRAVKMHDAEALEKLAAGLKMDIVVTGEGERLLVNGEDVTSHLRTPDVESTVSDVSKVAGVRTAMVAQQRRMAEEGRVVMVGRDIGSNVLPHAAKVYLDASVDVRVQRRLSEVAGKATEAEVRANVELRDRTDSQRAASPLKIADQAIVLLTDDMDVDDVVDEIVRILNG